METQTSLPDINLIGNQIVIWAKSQVHVRENGDNSGEAVENYQRTVDGRANKESWCMAFVQTGAAKVCSIYGVENPLPKSELCTRVWDQTPMRFRIEAPMPGCIFIQKDRGKVTGHTGIITTEANLLTFGTIEGNIKRNGVEGVHATTRFTKGNVGRIMLGYIDLPAMILETIENKKP